MAAAVVLQRETAVLRMCPRKKTFNSTKCTNQYNYQQNNKHQENARI
jgi:hypothetical protein